MNSNDAGSPSERAEDGQLIHLRSLAVATEMVTVSRHVVTI